MSSDAHEVAKQAAYLLYSGAASEYIQAKKQAAAELDARALPSNFDVAMELDSIAEELEGWSRRERLVALRTAAFETMQVLENRYPKLIGSVWRGTANASSDIDIVVYSDNSEAVLLELAGSGVEILRVVDESFEESGEKSGSIHIHAILKPSWNLEVIVRPFVELGKTEFCDIFGDQKRGLGLRELGKVLAEAPEKRFVPARRTRRR